MAPESCAHVTTEDIVPPNAATRRDVTSAVLFRMLAFRPGNVVMIRSTRSGRNG